MPAESGAFPVGAEVYRNNCAACHDASAERAPQRSTLQSLTPEAILRALTTGPMSSQGAGLAPEARVAVAEYLANRSLGSDRVAETNRCSTERGHFDRNETPAFTGWGLDAGSTHAVSARDAGLTRAVLPRLRLKWAFGFANSLRVRSQPALAGGALFAGSHNGNVYALDRATGCVRWSFAAEAEVRTAIIVGPWKKGDRNARPLLWFGDMVGNVYAVEAFTGTPVWKISADDHPAAAITGAPTLNNGTLYVPVSALEEGWAGSANYPCCSFRGSVLALDAATGREKWRRWLVDPPVPQGTDSSGTARLGPSGVAVWSSPTIDTRRHQLYVATGDNYTSPANELSDSIVALDLATGKVNWHYQALAGDIFNLACLTKTGACPEEAGPDFDFGASPVLARGRDGRELLLAGQKSGITYGLNPETGALVWQTRVGRGGLGGGILFGLAAAKGRLFAPVSDLGDFPSRFSAAPGMHALDISSGAVLWHAPTPEICARRIGCMPGYSGAITVAGDMVLAGSDDGHMRIYDAANGSVLWDLDTAQAYPTVNGVAAKGGAIGGGAAPLAWKGQLIVSAGYGFGSKMPGNVLLVFEVR